MARILKVNIHGFHIIHHKMHYNMLTLNKIYLMKMYQKIKDQRHHFYQPAREVEHKILFKSRTKLKNHKL